VSFSYLNFRFVICFVYIRNKFELNLQRFLIFLNKCYPLIVMSIQHLQTKKTVTKKSQFNVSQSSATPYLFFSALTTTKPQKKCFCSNFLLLSILPASWFENIKAFYQIWPLSQWITSLITLILLYWITGYYYNKWLSDRGGWLTFQTRVWLIISDLVINLALGLYYMHHRNTLLGTIMLKCPIAISPVIFLCEMICVYVYYRYWKKK
jgi:hypothetical protein